MLIFFTSLLLTLRIIAVHPAGEITSKIFEGDAAFAPLAKLSEFATLTRH